MRANHRKPTRSRTDNKTRPTGASVKDYIAARASEPQRADCRRLMALLKKVTRQSPKMWGPSMVGYGRYRYVYESGRVGEAPVAAFAIRGRELVLYVLMEGDEQRSLLSRLGTHSRGKVCLYFKRLSDLDASALEQLVRNSVAEVERRYEPARRGASAPAELPRRGNGGS
jgi:hypothetical protein